MPDSAYLPPLGDPEKAEKYVVALINLINQQKVEVIRTDLDKFDLNTMQDHYRVDLKTYDVEVSHNIHPDNNKNFYTMLFNNLSRLADGSSKKVVLAYVHLTESQFKRFKEAADSQLEKIRQAEDAKRFAQVMTPFDQALQAMDAQVASEPQIQVEPQTSIDEQDLANQQPDTSDQITRTDNPWSDQTNPLGGFEEPQQPATSDLPAGRQGQQPVTSTPMDENPETI